MRPIHIILIIAIITVVVSCSHSNKIVISRADLYNNIVAVANNEDTIAAYQLTLLKGDKFLYTITQKSASQQPLQVTYVGVIKNDKDTVYLLYKKGIEPRGMVDYLVKEISGHYLIQYFTDGRKRIFLEINGDPFTMHKV